MKKCNWKYITLGMIVVIVIFVIVIDYACDKKIPNFFFLDEYGLEYVSAYWAGIGVLIVLVPTLINLLLVRLEQVSNEYNNKKLREKEEFLVLKRNLDGSIKNLNIKNTPNQCLSDIRDIENAIDKQIIDPKADSYNFAMLLPEHLIKILSDHLHSLLKDETLCLRDDAKYLMRYLFSSNHIIDYCESNDISIAEFEKENLCLHTFTKHYCYSFHKAKFADSIFDSTESKYDGILDKLKFRSIAIFENCTIKGCDNVNISGDSHLEFKNCMFEDSIEFESRAGNRWHINLSFKNSNFKGYTSFHNSQMNRIEISGCIFEFCTNFSNMNIDDIDIKNSTFEEIFNMQQSNVNSNFSLRKSIFKKMFIVHDTCLRDKYAIKITDLEISNKHNDLINFRAKTINNNKEYMLDEHIEIEYKDDEYSTYNFEPGSLVD